MKEAMASFCVRKLNLSMPEKIGAEVQKYKSHKWKPKSAKRLILIQFCSWKRRKRFAYLCLFVYAPLHEKDNEKFSECVVCKSLWCNVHLVNNATGAQGAHCILN